MSFAQLSQLLLQGTLDTLYMTLVSTAIAYLIGIPLGVILVITRREGICPAPKTNAVLGTIVNIMRSVPFLILIIVLIPFTRLVAGTSIGATATIVPLIVGAAPFIARMVESSLLEVDAGVVEAAQAMGASPWQIVTKVLLKESVPSLVTGAAIALTTILGYSAMAGAVGGGGLGDLAIKYGYHRYQTDVLLLTLVILVLLVQVIQALGNAVAKRIDHRK
ncbi:MAG: ABC transporter permease [Clostridiales bacterium]|nr:ABC transporter permease [Clostridiales bacterium]